MEVCVGMLKQGFQEYMSKF